MEIIAHRGSSVRALENSREAFSLALQQGADRIELDVRASRDGVPVVLHDERLGRTTTGHGRVADLTWEELSGVRLRNGEPLLSLAEALDTLGRRIPLYIDVKDPAAASGVIELAGDLEGTIVGSSDPRVLLELAAEAPSLKRALLLEGLSDPIGRAVLAGAHYAHLCWERHPDPVSLVTGELLGKARDAGIGVILWHEERKRELQLIGRLSRRVHGVCTNVPDLARTWTAVPPLAGAG